MSLYFPQVLEVFTIDAMSRKPIPRIALMLTMFAPRKNNYHFAVVTDLEGKACIKAVDVHKSIKTDQNLFPMDYASTLDECLAKVLIKVCTSKEITAAMAAMQMFASATGINEELLLGLKNSQNEDFAPTSQSISLDQAKDYTAVEIIIERHNRQIPK